MFETRNTAPKYGAKQTQTHIHQMYVCVLNFIKLRNATKTVTVRKKMRTCMIFSITEILLRRKIVSFRQRQ